MSSSSSSHLRKGSLSPADHLPTRPSLARLSKDSAAHHSSPSIMTMSKMYQDHKQQQFQQQCQQQQIISPPGSSRKHQTKRSPPIKNLLASSTNSSAKKLQKQVLSPNPENDYFSSKIHPARSSGSTSSSGATPLSPGAMRLPTFQSFTNTTSTPQTQSLSASKIYERRMKQVQEDNEEMDVDLAEEPLEDDDEVTRKYTEKLKKMTRTGYAEFFPGDSCSDVDINSDNDEELVDPKKTDVRIKIDRVETDEQDHSSRFFDKFPRLFKKEDSQEEDQSIMSASKKRNFFQRVAFGESDEFDPVAPDDNFFTKFVNFSGGGMVPNAVLKKPKNVDEEEEVGFNSGDIRLEQMDSEDFRREASLMVGEQNHRERHHSDATTLNNPSQNFLSTNGDEWYADHESIQGYPLDRGEDYVPPPEKVRGGVLSALLKMYQPPEQPLSRVQSPEFVSPVSTPFEDDTLSFTDKIKHSLNRRKSSVDIDTGYLSEGYFHKRGGSLSDISFTKHRTNSSTNLPSFNRTKRPPPQRPKLMKGTSTLLRAKREQTKAKITVHIADIIHRQRFVLRMCKALMLYGAPTHRLEEYLTMTARILEIDGQFMYFPGCMVVSFGDPITRTSEVHLVKCIQGLDLYKLHRIHRIYKQVVHDLVSVDQASIQLEDLLAQQPTWSPWWCVFWYGFSSAMVATFAFGGGWMNVPASFVMGLLVGFLQFIVAPTSQLYINVFEVAASLVVAFIGRALGSWKASGVCFASVTQGSLALILPGWYILCGAMELQSRNLVGGSVRMVYAIIYSYFLGYGITIGSALYGWIDSNATSETTCPTSLSPWFRFIFVPAFTIGLALINQARLFQLPVIILIACCGHAIAYFSSKHFYNSTQFTAAIASFVIGIMGNLYSRLFRGIAFSAMLPAVFVQIPAGISSADTLLSGVQSANQIVENTTRSTSEQNFHSLAVGLTLVNICIGITVGLFASAIVVYPFGKRSTGIFTL